MKCVHTLKTGRHKRHADITLLFQYIICIHARVNLFPTVEFGFGLIGGLRSQSTAMVMSGRSINLTTHFFRASLD